jgi:hypothetical protein
MSVDLWNNPVTNNTLPLSSSITSEEKNFSHSEASGFLSERFEELE